MQNIMHLTWDVAVSMYENSYSDGDIDLSIADAEWRIYVSVN